MLLDAIADPDTRALAEETVCHTRRLQEQITFTKDYQDIGVRSPTWHRVGTVIAEAARGLDPGSVRIIDEVGELEIYADPLLTKVFYNLIENAIRYGRDLTGITFSFEECVDDGIVIVVQDDGVGVPEKDKARIFEHGVGSNTGLGLFLVREILAITDLTIRECGRPGQGARFEIGGPQGSHRNDTERSP